MAERLDRALVRLGLVETRTRAQALIAEGGVTVDGRVERRAAAPVDGRRIALCQAPMPWVSRGALKLLHGLEGFGFDPAGRLALDLGASTGGFTEVLLARGAARVIAVDVGRGQLHSRVAGNARVQSLEGTDARALTGEVGAPEAIVADLSFISLTVALPGPLALAAAGAWLVALVKPQFEVGRAAVGKGGIVRDPAAQAGAVARVAEMLAAQGWDVAGEVESPIQGGDGNREWLIGAEKRLA